MKDKSKRSVLKREARTNKPVKLVNKSHQIFCFSLQPKPQQPQCYFVGFYFQKMVKKFSQLARGGEYAKKIVKALHQYLENTSNGDIDALLEAYLRSRQGKRYLEKILNKISNEKLDQIVECIRVQHSNAPHMIYRPFSGHLLPT
jgi:hypothetical protein